MSTAYSKRPLKNPGPCGRVSTHPYRAPRFQTPVLFVPPGTVYPPPVHTCTSCPPSSGPDCARTSDANPSITTTAKIIPPTLILFMTVTVRTIQEPPHPSNVALSNVILKVRHQTK